MRIVVVGNIVADTIEHVDGTVSESLGGIAHTVSALSALSAGRHEIVPVCRLGDDRREHIEAWAKGLAGVSLQAVLPAAGPHPTVRLSYAEGGRSGERVERLRNAPAPLGVEDLAVAAGAAVVVVNCITGDDVTTAAVRYLREQVQRVYLDVHSLALGTAPGGRRFYRRRSDWSAWFESADVVQCNLAEAAVIGSLAHQTVNKADAAAVIERLLGRGATAGDEMRPGKYDSREDRLPRPRVWLLTLGQQGALLLQRRNGEVTTTHIAAPVVDTVDPTGAGDAFGAGYVCAWLDGCGPREAAQCAVLCGSAACTRAGAPDPRAFHRTVALLRGVGRQEAPAAGQKGSSSAICRSR